MHPSFFFTPPSVYLRKKTATIHNLHPSLNETFGSNHKQLWPREQKQNAESGKDSSNAFVSRQVVYIYIYKAKILRLIALAVARRYFLSCDPVWWHHSVESWGYAEDRTIQQVPYHDLGSLALFKPWALPESVTSLSQGKSNGFPLCKHNWTSGSGPYKMPRARPTPSWMQMSSGKVVALNGCWRNDPKW